MRAYCGGGDLLFLAELFKIGNRTDKNDNGVIFVNLTVGKLVSTVYDLISKIDLDISNLSNKSHQWLCEKIMISPRNDSAEEMNNIILEKIETETHEYSSIDMVIMTDDVVEYPQEFLNSLNPPGLPPHKLKLEVGCTIILLRNLESPNLCNGTRLRIKSLRNNIIEAVILTALQRKKQNSLLASQLSLQILHFNGNAFNFPLKFFFAISINEGQG